MNTDVYTLKEYSNDFIVNEITKIKKQDNGRYIYFWLKKENYTLIRALEVIAQRLNLKTKNFGFAGTKDKRAITNQLISVYGTNKNRLENINLKDIDIDFYGYGTEPISLGNLNGNEFILTIRNYKKPPNLKQTRFINYFGKQRFSKNNAEVGLAILKKDFKKAIELILLNDGDHEYRIRQYLPDNPNNFTGALKLINKKILRMFVHAYQSLLWNLTVKHTLKNNIKVDKIPIVGFGTEFENDKVEEYMMNLLKKDGLNLRDFIVRGIPELSSEGTVRDIFIETDIKLLEQTDDIIKIQFTLPKGSYATEVIDQLFVN